MVNEIRCLKFAILPEETGLHLTFSFHSIQKKINSLAIKHKAVSKQLATANNILKATALTYTSLNKGIEKVP